MLLQAAIQSYERSELLTKAIYLPKSGNAKTFIITEGKRMALGPIIARPAGGLWIFVSHHMSYLPQSTKTIQFLSPHYFYGYMHGEAKDALNSGNLKEG